MASYTVASGDRGAWEKTLVGSTVDTVTFLDDLATVQVINEGTSGIYFRTDGVNPAVGSAIAYYAPPNSVVTVNNPAAGGTVVKLISTGAMKYSVSAAY